MLIAGVAATRGSGDELLVGSFIVGCGEHFQAASHQNSTQAGT
jgi:type IV secretory pathway VirB2 component (pilin)